MNKFVQLRQKLHILDGAISTLLSYESLFQTQPPALSLSAVMQLYFLYDMA